MPAKKLKEYLDKNNIKYIAIRHSSAFTAQEIAAKAHISGKKMAKTVMIKIDDKMAMAVLPATYEINFKKLKEIFSAGRVTLATESEFKYRFPDCEVGAMPPFGNLYDMKVLVAESLTKDQEIAFNAGTHTEIIKMRYADFKNLVQPKIFEFSTRIVSIPYDPEERWVEDY